MRQCELAWCERELHSRGFCRLHYRRQRDGVPLDEPEIIRRSKCESEGCQNKHYAKGFCEAHWRRSMQGKPMSDPVRGYGRNFGECGIEWCGRPSEASGFCSAHYARKRLGRDMDAPFRRSGSSGPCEVEGCHKEQSCKGMCNLHYGRSKRGIDLHAPLVRPRGQWGSWYTTSDGYIARNRQSDSGKSETQLQHRLVMEEKIGRKLVGKENVHHLDHDRANNHPDNLELWTTAQPKGVRVEDKTAWAIEWLKQYSPEFLAEHLTKPPAP